MKRPFSFNKKICLVLAFFWLGYCGAEKPAVIITEILPNPIGKDSEGEFIELFNQSESAIDLKGWTLVDEQSKTFLFKDNFLLPPQSFAFLTIQQTKINLNNDKDVIVLFNEKQERVDSVAYEKSQEGLSYSKNKDKWQWADPTPGKANLFPLAPTNQTNNQPAKQKENQTTSQPAPSLQKVALNKNLALFVFALFLAVFSGVAVWFYKKK
ncbi:lamin tail domain-containing protein [Candidatus Gribaldobacteria bacterium]|nr:lamin tail domain-containing protein [Candidatus Gribaldobacteria bacterium]